MYNNHKIDFSKLKVANYCRKSSESEDRQMLSLDSQVDEAKKIADFYKLPEFKCSFLESKSAKTEFLRPEFKKMIDEIKKGNIDCVVCWKIDRLARNMTEGGMIIDLVSSGVLKAIITHSQVYTPWDNVLMMSVEFGQGKQYVKDLSENVKRGQRKKASIGTPHGVASLGFLNDKTENKGCRKWLIDKDRFNIIKILFERFLTGNYSAGQLYKYAINDLKLTTVRRKRSGGEPITQSRIYEILKDPIYAGFFFYEGVRYELDRDLPRMISEKDHQKVKRLLSNNNIPKIQNHLRTYSGFIKSVEGNFMGQDIKNQVICDCKYKFSYVNKTHCPKCNIEISRMAKPKYLSYTYYYDVKKKKKGNNVKSINEEKVDGAMLDIFNNLDFSDDLVDWSRKYIHELKDKEIGDNLTLAHNNQVLREEYELKKAKTRALLRDGKISDEEYEQDIKILDSQYSDVKIQASEGQKWYDRMNEIVDISKSVGEVIESGDIEAKRNIISKLGSNLVWDEKNLLIINKKEIQALIDAIKGIRAKFPKFEPKNHVVNKGSNEKTEPKNSVNSLMLLR